MDKLRSYGVAHRELMPETIHDTTQYANNRAELSHHPTRVRERGMRCFKSSQQAQRFLGVHAAVYNLFNLGRHLVSAKHYRVSKNACLCVLEMCCGVIGDVFLGFAGVRKLICQYPVKSCSLNTISTRGAFSQYPSNQGSASTRWIRANTILTF